jgi:D-alanyl-D-alanine carboxypeptidase
MLLLLPARAAPAAGEDPAIGAWVGRLEAAGTSLRVVLRLERDAEGRLTGFLDSPDQGVEGLQAAEIVLDGNRLQLRVPLVNGVLQGRLAPPAVPGTTPARLSGTWSQGALPLPITLVRFPLSPQDRRPWAPGWLSHEADQWEADLRRGPAAVTSWPFASLAEREDEWLATPLPPSLRERLGELGASLAQIAPSLPEEQRCAAFTLAAGWLASAGHRDAVRTAARSALRWPGAHEPARYRLRELELPPLKGRRARRASALASRFLVRHRVPAVAYGVVREGRLLLQGAAGLASLELNAAARPTSVWEIGSVTKQFTAVAILQLVEDGRLSLDDSLRKHLPEAPESWSEVTIRHLLAHTSGIPNYTSLPVFAFALQSGTIPNRTPQEMLALVERLPLQFRPGERFAYCNTGYYLLGMILERLTGQGYGALLEQRLFRPLGMRQTSVSSAAEVLPGRVAGYSWSGTRFRNAPHWPVSSRGAAGALVSSVSDLARWEAALRNGTLLPPTRLEQMLRPQPLAGGGTASYGLGWALGRVAGRRVVAHGGGLPGWSADVTRFPEEGLAVIVLANRDGAPVSTLAAELARLYLPHSATPADGAVAAPETDSHPQELAGIASALQGRSPAAGDERGRAFLRRMGRARRLRVLQVRDTPGGKRVLAVVRYRGEEWRLHAVSREGAVTWLSLEPR